MGLANHSLPTFERYSLSLSLSNHTSPHWGKAHRCCLSVSNSAVMRLSSDVMNALFVFLCVAFSLYLNFPQSLDRKQQFNEWPCPNCYSSTRPNGTFVRQQNSVSGCSPCGHHIIRKTRDVLSAVFQISLPERPCSN